MGSEQPCRGWDDDHFDGAGRCTCPCRDCTNPSPRGSERFCVCPDCECNSDADHAAWVWAAKP